MLCYSSQDKVKNACSDHYQHKHWMQKGPIPVGSGLFMVCNGTDSKRRATTTCFHVSPILETETGVPAKL